MFQRNKRSYNVVVECKNENYEATYEFIEDPDENWDHEAARHFRDEFGEEPTEMHLLSRTVC